MLFSFISPCCCLNKNKNKKNSVFVVCLFIHECIIALFIVQCTTNWLKKINVFPCSLLAINAKNIFIFDEQFPTISYLSKWKLFFITKTQAHPTLNMLFIWFEKQNEIKKQKIYFYFIFVQFYCLFYFKYNQPRHVFIRTNNIINSAYTYQLSSSQLSSALLLHRSFYYCSHIILFVLLVILYTI